MCWSPAPARTSPSACSTASPACWRLCWRATEPRPRPASLCRKSGHLRLEYRGIEIVAPLGDLAVGKFEDAHHRDLDPLPADAKSVEPLGHYGTIGRLGGVEHAPVDRIAV